MAPETIHPETTIGSVHLTVADLERSVAYYRDRLGFAVRARAEEKAWLGAGGTDLLVLRQRRDAPRPRGTTGLYHFAVLVPSRLDLARSLGRLVETRTSLTGASDHLVSEALYLDDPDGNGIEIYRDRPRSEWPVENGQVRMAVDPLDLESLLREAQGHAEPWAGLPGGTRIGHVHLRVASIPDAERFYVGVLGFEIRARYGSSASFLAAGGYHHHLGLNTWASLGAPPLPAGAIGLEHYVIGLPDEAERDRVAARARDAGVVVEQSDEGHALRDPSGIRILLAVRPQPR